MKRSAWFAIVAVSSLVGIAACSSNNSYLCIGECPATDGGTSSIDQLISADNQTDATTACYQALTTLAGQTCTASNSSCGCAQQ